MYVSARFNIVHTLFFSYAGILLLVKEVKIESMDSSPSCHALVSSTYCVLYPIVPISTLRPSDPSCMPVTNLFLPFRSNLHSPLYSLTLSLTLYSLLLLCFTHCPTHAVLYPPSPTLLFFPPSLTCTPPFFQPPLPCVCSSFLPSLPCPTTQIYGQSNLREGLRFPDSNTPLP